MCLILLAYQVHPRYPLILAANRDEFYARPTAPAAFWEDAPAILAGRDLLQGGTWLGVTRQGRLAAVTNLRDGRPLRGDAPSRGQLVGRFLAGKEGADRYLRELRPRAREYNGFNLLVGDHRALYFYCSGTDGVLPLSKGVHGISNHPPESPWPKTLRGNALLTQALSASFSEEALFSILADASPPVAAADRGEEGETELSPIFMRSAAFGTRCSTLFLLGDDGAATFVERTFGCGGERSAVRFSFTVRDPSPP